MSSARFSQRELRELSFEISARWFSREPSPGLTLSVVHPWRIHAYWHITPAMMEKALSNAKPPHALVIRFTDLTPGQPSSSREASTFDIEVDGLDNNWYINILQPGRHYCAELGLRDADKTLHVFVVSNEIQVPRAEPSPALEFSLSKYQGAKPMSAPQGLRKSAFSVTHHAGLLPPFSGFPDKHPHAVNQTLEEPAFPGAPLRRVQNWDQEPTMDDGAAWVRKRSSSGTEFPEVSIETGNESRSDVENTDSPMANADIPELPPIDPPTVSGSSKAFASDAVPGIPTPEESSAKTTDASATESGLQATSSDKDFPEVRAPVGHLHDNDLGAPLPSYTFDDFALSADTLGTEVHEREHPAPPTSLPQQNVGQFDGIPRTDRDRLESSLVNDLHSDSPTPPSSRAAQGNGHMDTFAGASAAVSGQGGANPRVPAGPAPKPVVPLEEAIAETYFSATNYDNGLDLSVELGLSGISSVNQSLTLFGESVKVDDQGRFSVRLRLNKGPQLTALLRAQRKDI